MSQTELSASLHSLDPTTPAHFLHLQDSFNILPPILDYLPIPRALVSSPPPSLRFQCIPTSFPQHLPILIPRTPAICLQPSVWRNFDFGSATEITEPDSSV